jgi:hypothetical protein
LSITRSTVSANVASVDGGGAWVRADDGVSVSLTASTISGNRTGIKGGGIYINSTNGGTAEVRDSTISGNTAGADGGGVYTRTTAGGTSTIKQSTVSGNSANWRGGGVFTYSVGADFATISYATITANKADADANNPVIETGGGVFTAGTGILKLEQTIVAANIDPANHAADLKVGGGTLQTKYNLFGTNGGTGLAPAPIATPDANGNIVGGAGAATIKPGLGPLANNGGPTLTHALLVTSPAVNKGNPTYTPGSVLLGVPLYDQRGEPFGRVQSGPGAFRIDIGAFELSDVTINELKVDSLADDDDGDTSEGHFSIREAFRIAHSLSTVPTIVFDPALSGGTINLTGGQLLIARQMTIDATALPGGITTNAGGRSEVFHVNGIGRGTVKGLTISGGTNAMAVEGGGSLAVADCLLDANSTGIFTAGNATVTRTTIRNSVGAGINVSIHGGISLTDSTIANNRGHGVSMSDAFGTFLRNTISGNQGDGITASNGLSIDQCTISENGGVGVRPTSGFGNVTISSSAIVNNTGAGVQASHAGALTIINSTISGNKARGVAAIGDFTDELFIRNSTITANVGERGAGLFSTYHFDFKIFNSIVSGNTDVTNNEHDIWAWGSVLYHSLLGRDNVNNPYGVIIRQGSIVGTNENPVDPMLGPLADNGGPTLTHMLLPGSIAINAGDPAAVAGQGGIPTYDQRGFGFGRIAGGRIDMGAVEAGSIANTAPVITSPATVNVPENSTIAIAVAVTDPDLPPQTLTYTITGGADAAKFQISGSGVLSFLAPPDFEVPGDANGDRVYDVSIRVDDGVGGFDAQTLAITVTAVNDHSPVFLSPSMVSVLEGSTVVLPVTATDGDLPAQLVTYSIVGGADANAFAISPSGALFFLDPPDFAAPTDANGDNVYEATVQASDGAGGMTQQAILVAVRPVVAYPLPGDFNDNDVVDAGDLPVWGGHYGQLAGAGSADGDADGDHDVDGSDFLTWQRNLGKTAAATALARPSALNNATAASEPAADAEVGIDESTPWLASVVEATSTASTGVGVRALHRPALRPQYGEAIVKGSLERRQLAATGVASPSSDVPVVDAVCDAVFDDDAALVDALGRLTSVAPVSAGKSLFGRG